MGFLGSTRALTPALDALARSAIVFTRAYAQAPVTTVSHATILTGTFPPSHHVTDLGAPLPPAVPYLPQLLHDAGYRTAAFVGSLILDPRNGTASGFDRGFDLYDAGFHVRSPGDDRYRSVERRGDEVAARALEWLSRPAAAQPWFAWIHFFDPHDPYDPPAELKRRFPAAPYDGEIAGVDRLVGRVMQAVAPGTIVAVAADHGEALGDHGEETHGLFLYDAVLHVPLVIRLPGVAARRVDARVRLADLAPTLLEAAGLAVPVAMQGQSLQNVRADRPAYAETNYPRQAFGWSPLSAWRNDRFLLIRAPKPELYDLTSDPGALHNLASSRSRVVDGMAAELEQFLIADGTAGNRGAAGTTDATRPDPALAERLAALGYVSGTNPASRPGIDPKDRIAVANTLHRAVVAVEDGAFQKAAPLLEEVVASEPDIPLAQFQLGMTRARLKQYARAIPHLTKAVALNPDQLFGRYELGVALYETGDLQNAAKHLAIVAARMPAWADARYSLGSVYARIDRVADAQAELRAALALAPAHFRANLLLGRLLTLQNQIDAAIPYLEAAVAADPSSTEARAFLAEAMRKRRQ
jgi:arylsulfatase A-like enzyme/Flp pilus assembly protein TadD